MNNSAELVEYEDMSGGHVSLSFQDIKKYICPLATNQEMGVFLQLCKYQRLNPFLREVYLIKYSASQKASTVTGKETFTKRAESMGDFDGFKAGIILYTSQDQQTLYREGALVLANETLVGGWAEITRKNWKIPVRAEVSFEEYVQYKENKTPNYMWQSKPATMIRKVALVQALREAFPRQLGGLYDAAELPLSGEQQGLSETPILVEVTPEPAGDPSLDLQTLLDRIRSSNSIPELENVYNKYVRGKAWDEQEGSVIKQAVSFRKTAIVKDFKASLNNPQKEKNNPSSPSPLTELKSEIWAKIAQLKMPSAKIHDMCIEITQDKNSKTPNYMTEEQLLKLSVVVNTLLEDKHN